MIERDNNKKNINKAHQKMAENTGRIIPILGIVQYFGDNRNSSIYCQ